MKVSEFIIELQKVENQELEILDDALNHLDGVSVIKLTKSIEGSYYTPDPNETQDGDVEIEAAVLTIIYN